MMWYGFYSIHNMEHDQQRYRYSFWTCISVIWIVWSPHIQSIHLQTYSSLLSPKTKPKYKQKVQLEPTPPKRKNAKVICESTLVNTEAFSDVLVQYWKHLPIRAIFSLTGSELRKGDMWPRTIGKWLLPVLVGFLYFQHIHNHCWGIFRNNKIMHTFLIWNFIS